MRIKERVNPRVATLRRPDDLDRTFAATRYPYRLYVANIVIAIWILAVAVRLIMIDQPYVDHWSWRQSDVAAIARNFFEHGFRFGYPQIDWAGGSGGYVGTEFPILPFLAAICYKFAGIHEWIGRSQSVIFFAISFPFFFLLVREIFGDTSAVWAAFFYAFAPLNVFAGRSFMPDVPSLSLAIIGLYFFLLWLRDRGMISFCLAAIAISLSILIKATSIVIAAPLAYICRSVRRRQWSRREPATCGQVPDRASGSRATKRPNLSPSFCLPPLRSYLRSRGIGMRIKSPRDFIRIISLAPEESGWRVSRGTGDCATDCNVEPHAGFGSLSVDWFVCSATLQRCSAVGSPRRRFSCLFDWWLATMILFVVAVGYGNRHPWYQLPFVPIAAAFAGAGCAFFESKISSRVTAVALSILLASSFAILAFLYVRPLYESSAAQHRDAGLRT